MSLSKMLLAYDIDALAALASVGLVRRAQRDFEAGKAQISAQDETTADVLADGQHVILPSTSITDALCHCPASGICRHIILAIIAVRTNLDNDASDTPSVLDDLKDLTETDLRKFAGADWDKALNIARISGDACVSEDGVNLSITLPDLEFPILFIAGQGLNGAVYKGAKTTKRHVVCAAALKARDRTGIQALETLSGTPGKSQKLSVAFITQVQTAIEALVTAVIQGGSLITEDALFDLSISARAQSAPRLSALLRLLIRHAKQARAGDFKYSDDRLLSDAGLAYALTKALEKNPNDTQLTGVLRRISRDVDDIELTIFGAVKWQSESGARGLRIYAYAQSHDTWYAINQARAAGMDPSFSPEVAYSQPLWEVGVVNKLMGRPFLLKSARLSQGHDLTWDQGRAQFLGRRNSVHNIDTASFGDWDAARKNLVKRINIGLSNIGASVPIMLRPHNITDGGFDANDQVQFLNLIDRNGAILTASIPADRQSDAQDIINRKSTLAGLLCDARLTDQRLTIMPITVLHSCKNDLEIQNLTLDDKIRPDDHIKGSIRAKTMDFIRTALLSEPPKNLTSVPNAVEKLASSCFDTIEKTIRYNQTDDLPRLSEHAASLQLGTLSERLSDLNNTPNTAKALQVCYLLSSIVQLSALRD